MDKKLSAFERKFFDSKDSFMYIGSGEIGGKAHGLAFIDSIISTELKGDKFNEIQVNIPTMAVLRTDIFDAFLKRNNLYEIAYSDLPDERIAHAFQKADLPVEILGDLRSLVNQVKTPLAIRSSSLLEDAKYEPFAGIYATKMIPNNQFDPDSRFRKLLEAIKFVYSSTFFKEAKDYMMATKHDIKEEKMAVIIQEVVGERHGDRFYPPVSGVARSYNFYSAGHARPEDGVVDLALGLGKTIVDGGRVWTYSPPYPRANPPCTLRDLLRYSQTEFWAVNMGKPPAYDPVAETEYMVKSELNIAEEDGILRHVASTYNGQADRLYTGTGYPGIRVVTFAPILHLDEPPLNDLIKYLLEISEKFIGSPVEIEFAMTLGEYPRFGFLQVRPMVVSNEAVEVLPEDMKRENVLLASENVLGNGKVDNIENIVYVKPESFNPKDTRLIAGEIEKINKKLLDKNIPYLLMGFGRWGSSDPWLGIPVSWSQICGAKVMVEATLPEMNVDLSQGSHFFHNITSLQVNYFSVTHSGNYNIDWPWIDKQEKLEETHFVKHVKLKEPLLIKVDGRNSRGVIQWK